MAITRHLAFDLGAESGRAIVGIFDNGSMTLDEIHRFKTGGHNVNDSSYWDIINIYDELISALKKYSKKYGPELDSLGIDAWGVDFGLLDCNGKLVSMPYTYRDERVNDMDLKIDRIFGKRKLYDSTGIQMLPINTLNQVVGMLNKNDPTLQISDKILFIGDLLHYLLTGEISVEYTGVSISQLYNNIINDWDDEIFNKFNIPEKIQGKVIRAGDFIGYLKKDICRETGISKVKVIAPAVHDTASASVAVPAGSHEKWAYLSSGTWSIVGIELDSPIINDISFEMNVSNSGGVLGKTLFLKNVMGLWIIQQCKKEWNKADPDLTYEKIDKQVLNAKPFKAFFDPDDLCFFSPANMLEAVTAYVKNTGQGVVDPFDIGAVSRIVYESLAFKYNYVLSRINKSADKTEDVLYLLDGGAKNEILNQFTSNATGLKIVTGHAESTAIGNILMQCKGLGLLNSLDEMRSVVRNCYASKVYMPDETAGWRTVYNEYLDHTELK